MTDLLLQIGISNVLLSLALALVAWSVQATGKRPMLAHLLWLLVLVKLVTPPLVTVPLIAVPGLSDAAMVRVMPEVIPTAGATLGGVEGALAAPGTETAWAASPLIVGKSGLALLWLLGSASVLAWSLVRVTRFDRLLRAASEPASAEVQGVASELAQRLGLAKAPTIYATSAQLSPMVWWVGGSVRVFLPAKLIRNLESSQLRWILAHELAHVRRRDHLVRWLEWLACVCFWWNPVAWWARRNLRANEELCCDALVLSSLKPKPRAYAASLLSVVEFLSTPSLRAPAMACAMDSGGSLEGRFRMIMSNKPLPTTQRWLQAVVLLCAVGLMPLGVAHAQDEDKKPDPGVEAKKEQAIKAKMGEVRKKIAAAVEAGELTEEEGKAKWKGFLKKLKDKGRRERERGLSEGMKRRLAAALEEGGLTAKQIEQVFELMPKLIHMIQSRSGWEPGEEWRNHFTKTVGLTEKQIELVVGLSRRVAPHVNVGGKRKRPSREELGKVKEKIWAGVKAGKLTEEQAQARWKGYLRRFKERGNERDGLGGHFKKLGVNKEQLGRIKRELAGAGIEGNQLEGALGGILRLVHANRDKGDEFELDARVRSYFTGRLGLTDAQVELVVEIARRLANPL